MQDSLKDQLLKAGFEEKKQPPPRKKVNQEKRTAKSTSKKSLFNKKEKQATKERLKRKSIKAQIKSLIEKSMIKEHKGEQPYNYILGNRVKQIYLSNEYHQKVSHSELAITRLNGVTMLIPVSVAADILKLNPDWAIIIASDSPVTDTIDKQYSDFQVPDDLQW